MTFHANVGASAMNIDSFELGSGSLFQGVDEVAAYRIGEGDVRCDAAARNTCGSGLPAVTSSAETIASNSPANPSTSNTTSTFARGADEAIA